MYPENSASTASRYSATTCCSAFCPPTFDPVLNGGKRDKHAVISPQVPTGRPVRQAVFDHQPHRPRDDTVGVMALGRSQVQQVRTEVTLTLATVMLRVGEMDVARSLRDQI